MPGQAATRYSVTVAHVPADDAPTFTWYLHVTGPGVACSDAVLAGGRRLSTAEYVWVNQRSSFVWYTGAAGSYPTDRSYGCDQGDLGRGGYPGTVTVVFENDSQHCTATFAGIRVKRIKTMLFIVSGVICAVAGALLTFRLSTAVNSNGLGLELDVVAVVLLGGVSIFGGKGTIVGVVLGVLAFAGIQNALLLTSFNQEAASIPVGGLLLVSVFVPNMAALTARLRAALARRGRAAPSAIGSGHD